MGNRELGSIDSGTPLIMILELRFIRSTASVAKLSTKIRDFSEGKDRGLDMVEFLLTRLSRVAKRELYLRKKSSNLVEKVLIFVLISPKQSFRTTAA